MSSPLIRIGVLAAALAAALAFSGSALASYPTKPVFDPLPALVVPDQNGSVEVGWTSTFWFGWQSADQKYNLKIESYPPPPWAPTTEWRTFHVLGGSSRIEGPLARHGTLRVGAGAGGHYVVRVEAAALWYGAWDVEFHAAEAAKAFDVAPPGRR